MESMVSLPADLVTIRENPSVPLAGSNRILLDWALACAANTRQLNDQMARLRELEHE